MKSLVEFIPFNNPRKQQVDVLKEIEKAFSNGYKNVLLQQPVGGGKSGVAIAAARFFGSAHVLTPRKSLQDQYIDDFKSDDIVMMKGRKAYPCMYYKSENEYHTVVELIEDGHSVQPTGDELSCEKGPCKNNSGVFYKCVGEISDYHPDGTSPCPYKIAIRTAQRTPTIIHNLHSFIFQAYFFGRFDSREIIIIDECHEIENIIRGFAERKINLPSLSARPYLEETKNFTSLDEWGVWFLRPEIQNLFSNTRSGQEREGTLTPREEFLATISTLISFSDKFKEFFVVGINIDEEYKKISFTFTPEKIADLVNKFLLDFGNKRLLMSGTVYNKTQFCINNGLREEETCFISASSTFPIKTRPIYFKKDYVVDTSHAKWNENFPQMIANIKKVLEIFHDVKGLIHTPSYSASQEIYHALQSTKRMVIHSKDDFQDKLNLFYKNNSPKVFLSPICQQGVDFKYDRARFQIILRVPYSNTSDAFNAYKVKSDFPWYNYQALIIFGQQTGRVNRAPDDFGVTILMDERFGKFLQRNSRILPKWLLDSIIYN